MPELPLPHRQPLPEPERGQLLLWLRQWEVERILQDEIDSESEPAPAAGDLPAMCERAPYDDSPEDLKPGQLRLLSSDFLPLESRPLYFLILSDWDDDMMLASPFSRFSVPATTGELSLPHLKGMALHTLCLWNSRTFSRDLLARSWHIDELTESDLQDARQVFDHVTTGDPISESLQLRCGPAIRKAEDPRLIYQAEESELLDVVSRLDALFTHTNQAISRPESIDLSSFSRFSNPSRFRAKVEAHSELALAAADRPQYRMVCCDGELFDMIRSFMTGRLPRLLPSSASPSQAICLTLPHVTGGIEGTLHAQWSIKGQHARFADSLFSLFNFHTAEWIGDGDFSPDGSLATLRRGNLNMLNLSGPDQAVLVVYPLA